ncbi:hypothetical protein QE152_g22546 [Popillia japonica]|uniref:Uncharacterized protein n=1 Tax=Popillia japonica TaxID=7064 RepID=A0AAW1KJX7_POPJA
MLSPLPNLEQPGGRDVTSSEQGINGTYATYAKDLNYRKRGRRWNSIRMNNKPCPQYRSVFTLGQGWSYLKMNQHFGRMASSKSTKAKKLERRTAHDVQGDNIPKSHTATLFLPKSQGQIPEKLLAITEARNEKLKNRTPLLYFSLKVRGKSQKSF